MLDYGFRNKKSMTNTCIYGSSITY